MTHPTPIPESLADTLAALARIKAGDGSAPGLDPRHLQWLRHDPTGSRAGPQAYWSCDNPRDALAHLLDVCMGVMGWAGEKHMIYCEIASLILGEYRYEVEQAVDEGFETKVIAESDSPTHLSAACAVVRAIADVVGTEKEGASDGQR